MIGYWILKILEFWHMSFVDCQFSMVHHTHALYNSGMWECWLAQRPPSVNTYYARQLQVLDMYHFTETFASFCASTTIFVNNSILRNILCCKFNFSHSCSVILIILTTWTVIETLLTHLIVTSNTQKGLILPCKFIFLNVLAW